MGCCAARRPRTWSPNPIAGYQSGLFGGWRPVVGDVETSAGAVPGAKPSGACCDACAAHQAAPASSGCGCGGAPSPEPSGCASGACGLNQYTAGIKLPLSQYSVNAGAVASRPAGATMVQQANAWAEAAGMRRSAGRVSPLPITSGADLSEPADLRALSDLELYQRETDLQDAVLGLGSSDAASALMTSELDAVSAEITRRETADPLHTVSAQDEADYDANRREVAETTARQLEPGDDPASRARRDRIIAQSITGTLATFNNYLQQQYGARVANINAGRDITLLRLRNEDRQAEREYRLALERTRGGSGGSGGSGGGGAAPVIGIGLLGLLWSVMR